MERQTLTVEEAGRVLGISRTLAYRAARQGELPVIRIGRRYLVLKAELQRLLASPGRPVEAPPSPIAPAGEADA